MSKAEEKALEAYPPKLVTYSDLFGEETLDNNGLKRTVFIEGYHQAEKDLELGWDDISKLNCLLNEVEKEFKKGMNEDKSYIGYCQEVLKRFKEDT